MHVFKYKWTILKLPSFLYCFQITFLSFPSSTPAKDEVVCRQVRAVGRINKAFLIEGGNETRAYTLSRISWILEAFVT